MYGAYSDGTFPHLFDAILADAGIQVVLSDVAHGGSLGSAFARATMACGC
jgi:hypothetical protein